MVDSKEGNKFDLGVKGLNKHKVSKCETLKPSPSLAHKPREGKGTFSFPPPLPCL